MLVGPTGSPGRFRRLRELAALAQTTPRESLPVLLSIAREYLHVSPLRYLGTWFRAAHDHPVEHAAQVRCPVLVLIGERDPVPTHAYVELLRQSIPDVRVEYIAGGAHGVPYDRADEFNRRATEFCGNFCSVTNGRVQLAYPLRFTLLWPRPARNRGAEV